MRPRRVFRENSTKLRGFIHNLANVPATRGWTLRSLLITSPVFPLLTESWLQVAPVGGTVNALDAWGDLVEAARQGDQAAARRLVNDLYPHIIRIIRVHLPARTDEEDVAQEVFMKMFAKVDQYRGPQPFHHWVCRIATNTCLDLLRRQKVRPEVRFSDLSEAEQFFLSAAAKEVHDESPPLPSEGREIVEKLLAALKPDQQLVIRLLDLERLSVKEICNQTGWSASKVKVTAMRARRKLTESLAHLDPHFLP